jgi:uncharacterized protein YcfJ
MKPSSTILIACIALTLIAMGCETTPPEPKTETVVTTTTRYTDSDYGYRRRPNERLYEAPVTSVRAVVGQAEERCWIERERVSSKSGSVGGAVAGAIVGGVLGHQIGRGRGQDVATVGGAVAGGAIGANAGKKAGYDRDVKHCETVADNAPDYWDVTYEFRGVTHHVQLTDPPGRSVTVNGNGEPRV